MVLFLCPFLEVIRMAEVIFIDCSAELLDGFDDACIRALERCGEQAEGYAGDLVPPNGTGNLKNSISHKVDTAEKIAYVGTDCEYAGYVEFGTGRYSSIGGGTPKTHWVYMGDDGEFHIGKPRQPKPFLKPAVANHVGTYRNIFKDELSK
jgi:HK97 gp10 family phage protein